MKKLLYALIAVLFFCGVAFAGPVITSDPETVTGKVTLATSAETIAGTDAAKVVTPDGLAYTVQRGTMTYAADNEASDTYVITMVPAIDGYVTGMKISFYAKTANTGAATININAKGAKAIKKGHDLDLADSDIEAGQHVLIEYDGTNFQMLSATALSASYDPASVAITGGTIDGTVVGGTTPAAGTFTSVKGDNLNYTEGILSAPTITAVDATHINVTTCDVLIRSDAVYGATDEMLYRKTVAANETLTITASVVNYIYVTWNSGTPIYAATTSRNTINNSNATPVARVVLDGASIKYQLSYGAIGKGNPAKNLDRVMRIRGSGGIEIESGFALTESATRVINVASGYAWFGLERITSATLGTILQGGGGVESEIWYHETTTGDWVHTTASDVYDNTQWDKIVAPYGLQTLTNTSRYAVNWVFRNITEDEIDIVLGNGDYTLAQATASMIPTLPVEISSFYVLCGRIIVKKSATTATLIENVADVSFRATATTVHSELSGLGYADAGHTGFQPLERYDTYWIPASAMTAKITNGPVFGESELGGTNDIIKTWYAFDTTTEQYVMFDIVMPEGWDRSTIKTKFYWSPTDDSGTTSETVEWELGGVAISDDDAYDANIASAEVIYDTILAGENADLHVSSATPATTVDGTPALGDLIQFEASRNVGGTDDYGADAKLFGILIQFKVTNSISAW